MNRYLWTLPAMACAILGGVALIVLPFGLHFSPSGSWNVATTNSFWNGIGLVVLGLVGVGAAIGAVGQDLVARGLVAPRERAERPVPPPRPVSERASRPAAGDGAAQDTDQMLRLLAESVLRDLAQQVQAPENPRRREGV
ncbi:MAG: hypothetical protein K6V97_08500 [Actinomycetia bacterium]|nr:hypothetical protein [Actinomycetes bacterium]